MSLWQKENEEKIDALTELQHELESEMQEEMTEVEEELSLVEKLALEAEEEIRMEKVAGESDTAGAENIEAEETETVEAMSEDLAVEEASAEMLESETAGFETTDKSETIGPKTTEESETVEEETTEKSETVEAETEIIGKKSLNEGISQPVKSAASSSSATDLRLLRRLEFFDKVKPYRRYLIGAAALIIGVFLTLCVVSKYSSVSGKIDETESTETPVNEHVVVAVSYTPQRHVPEGDKPDTAYMRYQDMQDSLKGWIAEFGKINIRDKADFEGKIIAYVVYGDQVTVFEQEGEFTRIKYVSSVSGETVEGYCFSEYISRTEPEGPQVYLNVPLYKQADQRWGAVKIGSYETLASAGCTTTCISMVESYMNGCDIFPDDVKATLYYTYDGRLVFPDYYVHHWARDYMTVAMQKLHEGIPVLVSGYNAAGGTHWVVLVAYKGDGVNLSSDLFLINDPGSPRYTLTDFMRDYPFIEKIVYYNK